MIMMLYMLYYQKDLSAKDYLKKVDILQNLDSDIGSDGTRKYDVRYPKLLKI